MVTSVRIAARDLFRVNGNPVEDFFAALFFYPGVALQLEAAAADAPTVAADLEAVGSPTSASATAAASGKGNPGYIPDGKEVSSL